ncbi:MAG: hypothetical protein KJS98_10595 [Nitrospirae bacterium]|nr:hypothetical protein [Nitrospirota bacterium]
MGHSTSIERTNVLRVFLAVFVATTTPLFTWSVSLGGDPTSGEQPHVSPAEQGTSSAQTPEASPAEEVQERAVPGIKITPNRAGSTTQTISPAPGTVPSSSARLLLQQRQADIYSGKLLTGGAMKPVLKGVSFVAGLHDQLAAEARLTASLRTEDLITKKPSSDPHVLHPVPGTLGVLSVNGKKSGFLLSPGNVVVVRGVGFGTITGRLLMHGLPAGNIDLSISDWRDDEIVALVPATLRGVPDGAVGVVVIKGEQQAHLDGGTFYAARQDYVVIGSNVQRFHKIQFAPLDPRYGSIPREDVWKDDSGRDEVLVNRFYAWDGDSSRLDLPCWSPGTDYLTTIDPGHGFVVTSLYFKWIGDTSSSNDHDRYGNAGNHWFAGSYSLGDWNGDTLPINWGVSHSHGSGVLFSPGYDDCITQYQIYSITVTGPAGFSTF